MTQSYPTFLERYLGIIQQGWKHDTDGNAMTFQLIQCKQGMLPNVITYGTLGLSHHLFQGIRQELFIMVDENENQSFFPSILHQVAMMAYSTHRPFLRGEVIGPYGPMIPDSKMEAFYVAAPTYLPDEFHIYEDGTPPPIVQVWLVPISSSEANYVQEHGWDAFEDLLVEKQPDLLSFMRDEVKK